MFPLLAKIAFTAESICFYWFELCFHYWQGRVSQDTMCFVLIKVTFPMLGTIALTGKNMCFH